jgi:signal transduction histidine kinase
VLKKLSFRAKLLLVLFVPFLALVVVAAAGLSDRFTALRAQEQYGTVATPLHSLDQLARAVENESVVTSWYISSGHSPSVPIANARARTDAAIARFRADEPGLLDAGATAQDLVVVNNMLGAIKDERRNIDDPLTTAPSGFFLSVDDQVLGLGETVARAMQDPEVAASVGRSFGLQRENEELAREAGVLLPVLVTGRQTGFSDWVGAIAAQSRYQQQFVNSATAAQVQAYDTGIDTRPSTTDLLRPFATDAALPTALPAGPVDPATYYQSYQQQATALDQATANVNDVIAKVSAVNASSARRDVWIYGGVAVFAMLLTLLLIWFVSRAVIRPVRKLTAAARDMSERQLPQLVESLREGGDLELIEPARIDVASEDEIGELARAFNDVEAVTMKVAREQSMLLRKGMGDLFVNLARRNQSLLERQLELLDELERNEHDPAALDALFKLDHMATRMRRNAESLLVLSGAEQPRQWQQPIALVDVVRAAAAEIADFPRVELLGIDHDIAVAGRAVADLAHLVAELLENATSFSPPDAAVVVSGAATANGYVLALADQGIGLPDDRLASANELLAHPPVVGLALSRALGLHVVGLLAARHEISVELRPGAPLGTVALVTLPHAVLENRVAAEPLVPAPEPSTPPVTPPLTSRPVDWRPPDEPPVEEWRREGMVTVGAVHAEPLAPEPLGPEPLGPVVDEPPPSAGPPLDETGPVDDAEIGPLPSRVPGHHLSHQPAAAGEEPPREADPLRPYHVHELLTRHQLGKRRGQAEQSQPGDNGQGGPGLEGEP